MNEKYIQIFNGYKGAYGVANIKNAYVDPDSGKLKLKPGDYRWNYEELTDQQLYQQAKSFSESISKGAVKPKHGEDKPKDQSII